MRASRLSLIIRIALIAGAGYLVSGPLLGLSRHQQVEAVAAQPQRSSSSAAQSTHIAAETPSTSTCSASTAPPFDYALLQFTGDGVAQYGYLGVSGDGNWDLLKQRNMVHWHGSPDPGQQGNMIIAFHREPSFRYINQLGAGQTVTVLDRACHSYVYLVETGYPQLLWPNNVTQLVPTSGRNLTLITCNPWYIDTQRYVWRADLYAIDGTPVALPAGSR